MIALIAVAMMQQGPFFAAAFPNPTGANGWEEYVMAVDIVEARAADRLVNYYYYNDWKESMEADRLALEQLGRACDLVRAGNRKRLDNRPAVVESIEFRGGLSNVVRLLRLEARVRFGEGKSDAGCESIIAAIDFADRVSDGGWIDVMSAHAKHQIALGSVRDGLPTLSLASAKKLRSLFEAKAGAVSPFVEAVKAEIREKVADMATYLADISEESEYWSPPAELVALSPAGRADYVKRISEEFQKLEQQIDPIFAREERFWKFDSVHTDPIIDYALSSTILESTPQIAARYQTQFRLAALHCRVMEFKRTHNRWPNALTELGGREVWYDPASGGPFFYAKLTDQSYTCYSLGTAETGRIDLVWRGPER